MLRKTQVNIKSKLSKCDLYRTIMAIIKKKKTFDKKHEVTSANIVEENIKLQQTHFLSNSHC